MNLSNLSEIVRHKIAEVKGFDQTLVCSESIIRDDLGVTSMEYITILTDVAMVLGIDLMEFSEREIITASTVGDLEIVIASKLTSHSNEGAI